MVVRLFVILLMSLLSPVLGERVAAQQTQESDEWAKLREVTHRRTYIVLLRDSNCIKGKMVSVTNQSLSLRGEDEKTLTLEKQNIVRVGDSGIRVKDVVYSGRSSWSDVKDIPRNPKEGVKVVAKNGEEYDGRLIEVNETQIVFVRSDQNVELPKSEISQVFYVRYKPLSESAEYDAQEGFPIDPQLWPYLLGIAPKIPVLVYDSSRPEDNATTSCRNNPRLHH